MVTANSISFESLRTVEHLMSKALGPDGCHVALNTLADFYLKNCRPRVALKCLLLSLWRQPAQVDTFEKAMSLYLDHRHPPLVTTLENPDRCSVSVILPTYNRPHLIRESIKSVLEQTFQDFELIIVNDGGSDEVERTIEEFQSLKIKYIKIDNQGLAAARNAGILCASGHYLTYLDDDDVYYPHHLETLISAARKKNADVTYSNVVRLHGVIVNNVFVQGKIEQIYDWEFDKHQLIERGHFPCLSIMHKRKLLEETGIFDEELLFVEDWDLWLRFVKKVSFERVPVVTAEYRVNDLSMTIARATSFYFYLELVSSFYQSFEGLLSLARAYYDLGDRACAIQYTEQIHEMIQQGYSLSTHMYSQYVKFLCLLNNEPLSNPLLRHYFQMKPVRALRIFRIIHGPTMVAKALPSFVKYLGKRLTQTLTSTYH